MENQEDDKDPNRTHMVEAPKVTLGEFIETNHKLLSTLGIFILLVIFGLSVKAKFQK
jgi:hypothetical protein